MIYVYAIVDGPVPHLDGLQGLEDTQLIGISEGSIAAICSVHDQFDPEPDARSLWRHEQVVVELMANRTVAPVRFGTMLDGVGPLRNGLVAERPYLVAALGRLRGKVELALRASLLATATYGSPRLVPPGAVEHSSGRAYLRARQRHCSANSDVVPAALSALHSELSASADDATVTFGPGARMVASYLVSAREVAAFRQVLARCRQKVPEMRVSLTGPWAGYSFVDGRALVHD